MARPRKNGLDYFSWDTSPDMKLRGFYSIYKVEGRSYWSSILEAIYREGFQLDISLPETRMILAADAFVSIAQWEAMTQSAINLGLFDKQVYTRSKILASEAIKRRWLAVNKKRLQNREFEVSVTETPDIEDVSVAIRGEIKGKEIKGNKKKRKPTAFVPVQDERNLYALYLSQSPRDTSSLENFSRQVRRRIAEGKSVFGLALSIYLYSQHQTNEKIEKKFWDKASNFFGDKATFERFYREPSEEQKEKLNQIFTSLRDKSSSSSSSSISSASLPAEGKIRCLN